MDRLSVGDASAATQLEVGKDLVAEMGKEIDAEAAQRIKDDLYVDDGLTGGDANQATMAPSVRFSNWAISRSRLSAYLDRKGQRKQR